MQYYRVTDRMHDSALLSQIAILFGMALVVAWVFRVARAPSIIGFLCTGMVIGPSTWGLIEQESVEQFAEIGLVLLLFTVGLELSPAPLMRLGASLVKAMVIQVGVVMVLVTGILLAFGDLPLRGVALVAVALSLSSTAIVLKQLSDRGELQSTIGNIITGILLLQDVFVIAVMVLLPIIIAGGDLGNQRNPAFAILEFAGLIALTFAARKFLPFIITQIIRHGGQELTTLFAVLMACGGAWVAQMAGWPPALGACIAGLLLASADIRHQLVAEIIPFRNVFNALFFISLGMTVNMDSVFQHGPLLAAAVFFTVLFKFIVAAGAVRIAGWPWRVGIQVGLGLATVSEFGYILVVEAWRGGLLPDAFLDGIVGYTVGTMIVGSILFPLGSQIAGKISVLLKDEVVEPDSATSSMEEDLDGHVIIVGYGINGENLVDVLTSTHIPHCVIEMNMSLVHRARKAGASVIVGDATRLTILHHAGIDRARAVVVAVNDQDATRRVVSQSRHIRSDIFIVARTYFVGELEPLTERGANIVVPADLEASVKIFSHVLEEYDVPKNILGAQIAAVRAGGYGVLRGKSSSSPESLEDLLKVIQLTATQTFYVPEHSAASGKSIAELNLRQETGATIIAVVRDREPNTNPPADLVLCASDVLVLVGSHEQRRLARKLMEVTSHLSPSKPADTKDP